MCTIKNWLNMDLENTKAFRGVSLLTKIWHERTWRFFSTFKVDIVQLWRLYIPTPKVDIVQLQPKFFKHEAFEYNQNGTVPKHVWRTYWIPEAALLSMVFWFFCSGIEWIQRLFQVCWSPGRLQFCFRSNPWIVFVFIRIVSHHKAKSTECFVDQPFWVCTYHALHHTIKSSCEFH